MKKISHPERARSAPSKGAFSFCSPAMMARVLASGDARGMVP